jgi:glutaredoxin
MFIKSGCPFCRRAVNHCKAKGIIPDIVQVTNIKETVNKLKRDSRIHTNKEVTTVPIIFVNEKYIGGSNEFIGMFP